MDSNSQNNAYITPTDLSGKIHTVVIDRLEWEAGTPVLYFRLIKKGLPITEADIEKIHDMLDTQDPDEWNWESIGIVAGDDGTIQVIPKPPSKTKGFRCGGVMKIDSWEIIRDNL